jgi:3-hydroxyisobutyrate dehydrogenase-like beta-hydroxyacid dehydrogenase
VPRLLAAGHKVTGWNRSERKAVMLVEAGMLWADSPRAVAEHAEIVFSIVTDSKAVRSVALEPDGIVAGIGKGNVMSTIEPDESRAVAAEFTKAGAIMPDRPLSRPHLGQPGAARRRRQRDDERLPRARHRRQ